MENQCDLGSVEIFRKVDTIYTRDNVPYDKIAQNLILAQFFPITNFEIYQKLP